MKHFIKNKTMIGVLLFALLLGISVPEETQAAKKEKLSTTNLTVKKGKTKTLKVKNAKKKIKWSIVSGKNFIKLKSKKKTSVKIVGIKAGKAKVQAKGKKKLICKITVKETKKNTQKNSDQKEKNSADVTALKKLIAEQKSHGGVVSENLDSEQYYWNTKGNLYMIAWFTDDVHLVGDISFSELKHLELIGVANNELTKIDVSGNSVLEILSCDVNKLTSLDVSNCPALTKLSCNINMLTSLDVSKNKALKELHCDKEVNVTGCAESIITRI